jgi:hypothetical protein
MIMEAEINNNPEKSGKKIYIMRLILVIAWSFLLFWTWNRVFK